MTNQINKRFTIKKQLKQCVKNKYQIMNLKGSGSFGNVYRGQNKETGQVVAIKKIKHQLNKQDGISMYFMHELSIHGRLNHPSIVKIHEICMAQGQPYTYIIMQYMTTDLQKQIGMQKLSMQRTYPLIKYLLQGIQYCHSNQIIHRDIKPANILYSPISHSIKIADFGIAKKANLNPIPNTEDIGSFYYRAPEMMLKNCKYSFPIDIWSTACVFIECLTGKNIFKGDTANQAAQLYHIANLLGLVQYGSAFNIDKLIHNLHIIQQKPIQNAVPQLKLLFPEQGLDLLNKMLLIDPNRRITAKQALRHQFFQKNAEEGKQESKTISQQ